MRALVDGWTRSRGVEKGFSFDVCFHRIAIVVAIHASSACKPAARRYAVYIFARLSIPRGYWPIMRRKTGVQPSTTGNQRPPDSARAFADRCCCTNATGIAWVLSFFICHWSLPFFFLLFNWFSSSKTQLRDSNCVYMESMIEFEREENCIFKRTFDLYDFYRIFLWIVRGKNRWKNKKEKKGEKEGREGWKIRMRRSMDSHLLLLAIDKYDHSASNYH